MHTCVDLLVSNLIFNDANNKVSTQQIDTEIIG